jgi:hypothetical protein
VTDHGVNPYDGLLMPGWLATGHPWMATGGRFDLAPLILAVVMLAGLRPARVRIRAWMIPAFMIAGLILDDLTDATGASTLSTIALTLAVSCLASIRRRGGSEELPPGV